MFYGDVNQFRGPRRDGIVNPFVMPSWLFRGNVSLILLILSDIEYYVGSTLHQSFE